MFKFSVRGQRVGRIAFGAVLLAGTALVAHRLWILDHPRLTHVIPPIWAAAFAAYLAAAAIGSRRQLDHAGELAVPGLVVPSVGAALLLPITLHLPFVAAFAHDWRTFDVWAAVGLVITAPTHLALAALVAQRARQLATGAQAISPQKIYTICVAVSCLPFAIFVIPPFLVALTGLPLAALIAAMAPLAARDRERAADEALPRAVAVARLPHAESLPRSG
jgi:hypothetical protein